MRRQVADGAQIVDARPIEAFAAGHIPGALSIELRDSFATWLGWLTEMETPLVFVFGEDQDRIEVVRQAHKVGYERRRASWPAACRPGKPPASPPAASSWCRWPAPARSTRDVLDVRQADEFAMGHVPGARHVELGSVSRAGLITNGPLTLMCQSGPRAMSAASILDADGPRRSAGRAWRRSGLGRRAPAVAADRG